MDTSITFISPGLIYELAAFGLSIIVLIMYVRIIVRVEGQLDTYFKVSALAFFFLTIRQLVVVAIRVGIIQQVEWVSLPSVLFLVTIIISLFIMGKLLNSMNRQK